MTPEQYLHSLGIDSENTVVVSYLDGVMRQPDLAELLKGYVKALDTETNRDPSF